MLDEKFQWLSPKRQQIHRDLDQFIGMIDEVIQTRRDEISRGDWKNKNLEENEKDILSLMIESENRGEGILSNEELKVVMCWHLVFLAAFTDIVITV